MLGNNVDGGAMRDEAISYYFFSLFFLLHLSFDRIEFDWINTNKKIDIFTCHRIFTERKII